MHEFACGEAAVFVFMREGSAMRHGLRTLLSHLRQRGIGRKRARLRCQTGTLGVDAFGNLHFGGSFLGRDVDGAQRLRMAERGRSREESEGTCERTGGFLHGGGNRPAVASATTSK